MPHSRRDSIPRSVRITRIARGARSAAALLDEFGLLPRACGWGLMVRIDRRRPSGWKRPENGRKLVAMVELKIATSTRAAFVDITEAVNQAVAVTRIAQGLCNLFVPHTTCAVIVSENWDPDVTTDMLNHLERLVPRDGGFRHGEGNSQAHILSAMLSTSINIPVAGARLRLGRWQGLMLAEWDGPRERTVLVSVVKAEG